MNEQDFPNTYAFLDEEGIFIVESIQIDIQKKGKVASGTLLNSIDYDIKEMKNDLEIVIEYADYGKFVLSGRKAGSRMPLRIKRIPISGGKVKPVGGYKTLQKKNVKSLKQLSKSIAKRGIKPFNFLEDVPPYLKSPQFKNAYCEAMSKDIAYQMKKELK